MFISHTMANIFLVSQKSCEIRWQNKKLGKYWPYCIWDHAVTNAYTTGVARGVIFERNAGGKACKI